MMHVKGLNTQDSSSLATKLVAGVGRGGGAPAPACNGGEGGRLEAEEVGD
jgi:hypothetical protein